MSTDRETTRIVRSWLESGVTRLPDRVLDAALDQLPTTPQRRSWRPTWRSPEMNRLTQAAIAAAAMLVVVVAGYNFLPRPAGQGGVPSPSSAPSNRPSPAPTATPAPTVPPPATRITFPAVLGTGGSVVLPDDWQPHTTRVGQVDYSKPDHGYLGFFMLHGVYGDPCHPEKGLFNGGGLPGLRTLPPGMTATQIVPALQHLSGFAATPPEPAVIGGFAAKHFRISDTNDASATCTKGDLLPLFVSSGDEDVSMPRGGIEDVWIMSGSGLLIVADPPASSADQAILDAIIASIEL